MIKTFRDINTGEKFIYRRKIYMKCANSYEKYDTSFNTWLLAKWPKDEAERFFRNDTKVKVYVDKI